MSDKSTRLVTLGKCIKEITLGLYESISYEEFKQLVTFCPNVELIDVSTWLRPKRIPEFLLDIYDDIKWGLRRIVVGSTYSPSADVYLKYKDSIVSIEGPSGKKGPQFLVSFPSLQSRILRSWGIKSMREFMFILDMCPKLTCLCIQASIKDASCLTAYPDIYPSLITLEMAITPSSMTRSIVDYISTRFINLSSVTLHTQQTNSSSFEENYIHLMNALMTPYKHCRKSADENAQMKYTRMLSKFAIEAFKLQPRSFNSIEFAKASWEPDIRICVDTELHCMLSTWTPFSYLIKQDALFGGTISHHLHKLMMECSSLSMNMPTDDLPLIEACTQIRELAFANILSPSFQNYHYSYLQKLSLSNNFVDISFFPTLGRVCPKLKVLKLTFIHLLRSVDYDIVIDMQDLRAQRLSLTKAPRYNSGKSCNSGCLNK
ncbi:hypothetical protein BCV72DRAFT_310217 [Rhizopus microsporus var. microsporus]|uniref:F-box domain-containing protein n=1 Tax=Rhizopus microsporus var. microsporus TaxID=86635 RepID=A0A1X0QNB5_RHIZD|nr:hypothetical protein BCV72DRAFT_310217 [Rhizopus microsporus var. microsporus]